TQAMNNLSRGLSREPMLLSRTSRGRITNTINATSRAVGHDTTAKKDESSMLADNAMNSMLTSRTVRSSLNDKRVSRLGTPELATRMPITTAARRPASEEKTSASE